MIVEARERSGALITADFALELGREVFAVPGEITASLSAGTNALIRQGAAPLLAAEDVLDALGVVRPSRPPPPLSAAASALLALLGDAPAGIDELAARSGCAARDVSATLVELELAGIAAQADGVYRAVGLTIAA